MEKIDKETIEKWKEMVKKAHDIATRYDPNKNLRSESDLEHIVYEALRKKIRYATTEAGLQEAGAFFLYEIATRHPFFDGNKRTSLMMFLIIRYSELDAGSILEKINNLFPKSWDNKDDKIVNFMVELASYKYDYDDVLKFVKETFK